MLFPVLDSQQLTYLRACKTNCDKDPTGAIRPQDTARQLGDHTEVLIPYNEGINIENWLSINGLLKVSGNQLKITRKGKWNIRLTPFVRFGRNYLEKPFLSYRSPVFYAFFLFLLYSVLESFLSDKLTLFFVTPVLLPFHPGWIFDSLCILLGLSLVWWNRNRKPTLADFLVLLLYIRYRFSPSPWDFTRLFTKGEKTGGLPLYIDFIALYFVVMASWAFYRKIKSGKEFEYADGMFYLDHSLGRMAGKKKMSIVEIDATGLKRNRFAMQLADIIGQMIPFEAFAIGICGPWGSGKTSLIQLIRHNLEKRPTPHQYLYIDFSPWFFTNSESLITNFFSVLEEKFRGNRSLAAELRAYGKELVMFEKTLLKTEFSSLLIDTQKGLKERYEAIARGIQQEANILVITIDDLDRLDRKEVVEVLRLIRLMADFPNTFYIVGYDHDYVSEAIKHELTSHNPGKYLDKVFNIEFKIPELPATVLRERIMTSIKDKMSTLPGIGVVDAAELQACFAYRNTVHIIRNERDVKRFTNNLLMRYLSVKQEINFYHFFLLELLYYRSQDVYMAIYDNRAELTERYKVVMQSNSPLTIDFKEILQIPDLNPLCLSIVDTLFNKTAFNAKRALNNELHFVHYFSLSLQEGDFSNEEFEAAFALPFDKLKTHLVLFNGANSALLAEKLHYRRESKEFNVSDKAELTKTIDSLLFLYDEVYPGSNKDDSLGISLNGNNLRLFIFNLLVDAKADPDFFAERVLSFDLLNYTAFSFLCSMDSVGMLEKIVPAGTLSGWWVSLRKMSLELLTRMIKQNGSSFDENILTQFSRMRTFISEVNSKAEDIEWFQDKVITGNKDYLVKNLKPILEFFKKHSYENEQLVIGKLQDQVTALFDNLQLPVYSDRPFTYLKDFYKGYDTIFDRDYSFTERPNAGRPDLNDETFDKPIAFVEGGRFEIYLNPHTTPAWRFGFRFGRTNEFPAVIKGRHLTNYPYIVVVKGIIETDGTAHDHTPPRLDLAVYSGADQTATENLINNYDQKPIDLSVERDEKSMIWVKANDNVGIREIRPVSNFADYSWVQIAAWADHTNFSLATRIKYLQKLK
ncbi:KAP family P-loop NTPase fold protein [Sediminibacterium roseum]|nr:P-loop NTPase fold protein [Sediminibacterium roseum]